MLSGQGSHREIANGVSKQPFDLCRVAAIYGCANLRVSLGSAIDGLSAKPGRHKTRQHSGSARQFTQASSTGQERD